MPLTVAFLVLAVAADDVSTAIALGRGDAVETNPISLALLGFGAGWLYVTKLALVPAVLGILSTLRVEEREVLRWLVRAVAVALAVIAVHNLTLG